MNERFTPAAPWELVPAEPDAAGDVATDSDFFDHEQDSDGELQGDSLQAGVTWSDLSKGAVLCLNDRTLQVMANLGTPALLLIDGLLDGAEQAHLAVSATRLNSHFEREPSRPAPELAVLTGPADVDAAACLAWQLLEFRVNEVARGNLSSHGMLLLRVGAGGLGAAQLMELAALLAPDGVSVPQAQGLCVALTLLYTPDAATGLHVGALSLTLHPRMGTTLLYSTEDLAAASAVADWHWCSTAGQPMWIAAMAFTQSDEARYGGLDPEWNADDVAGDPQGRSA